MLGVGIQNFNSYLYTDVEQDCEAEKVEAVSLHTIDKVRVMQENVQITEPLPQFHMLAYYSRSC